MGAIHVLKTWPGPFAAILDGNKRFEIRKDDRGFALGDVLHLREWYPHEISNVVTGDSPTDVYIAKTPPHYTGRECWVTVTYLVSGGCWGLPLDLCVMGISEPRHRPSGGESKEPCLSG